METTISYDRIEEAALEILFGFSPDIKITYNDCLQWFNGLPDEKEDMLYILIAMGILTSDIYVSNISDSPSKEDIKAKNSQILDLINWFLLEELHYDVNGELNDDLSEDNLLHVLREVIDREKRSAEQGVYWLANLNAKGVK
jgi:hypothetical protein